MTVDEIINSIADSRLPLKEIHSLPHKPGLYAFSLNNCNDLGIFGKPHQTIYVGLSEKSLNIRESEAHLKNGKTGWSSLRRSIGAILKLKLKLHAQKRDFNSLKLRADKYKFDEHGEILLTEWMITNLKLGFWSSPISISLKELREQEEKVILQLKPTLDLDLRTKQFNPLAKELDLLREICRNEVKLLI